MTAYEYVYASKSDAFKGSAENIEEIADYVADKIVRDWKMCKVEPIGRDIMNVLRCLGGSLKVADNNTLGSLVIEKGGRAFTVFTTPTSLPLRDTFQIAHELGHYFLHYLGKPSNPPYVVRRFDDVLLCQQANWFAHHVLMPTDVFMQKMVAFDEDVSKLSHYFCVPSRAVYYRLTQIEAKYPKTNDDFMDGEV